MEAGTVRSMPAPFLTTDSLHGEHSSPFPRLIISTLRGLQDANHALFTLTNRKRKKIAP